MKDFKINLKSLNHNVKKFLEEVEQEKLYRKNFPKAFDISEHFKKEMKSNNFILTNVNYEKSKDFAIEMISNFDNISVEDWKNAITYFLRNKRVTKEWWSRVRINHLGTIIKLYNEYAQRPQQENKRRRFSNYD